MTRTVTAPNIQIDDADDQLSFDSLTRREFGRRAIGDQPCINTPGQYCQAPILDAHGRPAICWGELTHERNFLGELLEVCTRPQCQAVRLVPRRQPPKAEAPICPKCGQEISGDNEVHLSAFRSPQCAHCKRESNRARRQRLTAKAKDAA